MDARTDPEAAKYRGRGPGRRPDDRRALGALPVLDPQARDPAELPAVVSYQHEVVRTGGGRDQQIVRSDGPTRPLEIEADEAGLLGAPVIEGEAHERSEESAQQAQVVVDTGALPGSVQEFGLHDGREPDLGRVRRLEARRHRRRGAVQDADADVRVQEEHGSEPVAALESAP